MTQWNAALHTAGSSASTACIHLDYGLCGIIQMWNYRENIYLKQTPNKSF